MRAFGFVLIVAGIILLAFFGYLFIRQQNRFVSPIPDDDGVKVIFITPGKE